MTPEAQQIAIAESVGWIKRGTHCDWSVLAGPCIGEYASEVLITLLADYLNDLNAMHEVEGTMLFSKRRAYKKHLQRVMTPQEALDNCSMVSVCELCFATASQRAEAYLRTIGKWTDKARGES
jgi:hypothetical protein